MRRERPAPMMPSTVLEPWSANGSDSPVAFAISENLKRSHIGTRPGNIANRSFLSRSRRGFESLLALRLVQKQLIIYLRKASIIGPCNQQVTGGLEARFLDHESCSLRKGIDD